jgi:hypothetical protein
MNDAIRQTGRTTKQLQALKPNALFVWCNGHMVYPKLLAMHLGREDITIVQPDYVVSDKWKGLHFSEVVLDHAYHSCNKWNLKFQANLIVLKERCRDRS